MAGYNAAQRLNMRFRAYESRAQSAPGGLVAVSLRTIGATLVP